MTELNPEHTRIRDEWQERIKAMIARRVVAVAEYVGEKTEPFGFEDDELWD